MSCATSILTSKKANLFRSWGRPAPGNPHCFTFLECTITAGAANIFLATPRSIISRQKNARRCETNRSVLFFSNIIYPSQLSGGQQQLVGVARAIISNPKLLLADEPTGNLHSSQGEEIMDLFKRLNAEGTTIVQVTHSEKNAAYGNRIIQLRDGWIVEPHNLNH